MHLAQIESLYHIHYAQIHHPSITIFLHHSLNLTLGLENTVLHERLNQIYPLTEEAWNEFSLCTEAVELNKGDYLLQEGERATYGYFQLSGVTRVFYNKDGNEYNKTFFVPGMFPTAITSLLSSAPSHLSFQALSPSRLIRFSFSSFQQLFDKHRCLESLMLKIMEGEWIKKEEHDIQMVTNDATTNYLIFRKRYPGLENQIPQYHIASYLGITPIQLSRIRASLTKSAL